MESPVSVKSVDSESENEEVLSRLHMTFDLCIFLIIKAEELVSVPPHKRKLSL